MCSTFFGVNSVNPSFLRKYQYVERQKKILIRKLISETRKGSGILRWLVWIVPRLIVNTFPYLTYIVWQRNDKTLWLREDIVLEGLITCSKMERTWSYYNPIDACLHSWDMNVGQCTILNSLTDNQPLQTLYTFCFLLSLPCKRLSDSAIAFPNHDPLP